MIEKTMAERSGSGSPKKTKLGTILRWFTQSKTLNRFEAEGLHDHCLHSTVSTLQNDYGVKIERKRETVPCLRGKATTSVCRYWLCRQPENICRAKQVLDALERVK